ncbi:hypothetical protein TNCV_4307951 [Trichonephila clavipes]|nr:hypothetical protein TNCV_4307951 [Trichonephila clavipes]
MDVAGRPLHSVCLIGVAWPQPNQLDGRVKTDTYTTLLFEQKLTEDGSESKEFRSVEYFVTAQKNEQRDAVQGTSLGRGSIDERTDRKERSRRWPRMEYKRIPGRKNRAPKQATSGVPDFVGILFTCKLVPIRLDGQQ